MISVRKIILVLTYIIAVLGVLPVYREVSPAIPAVFVLSLIYGYAADRYGLMKFPRIVLNIISVAVIAAAFLAASRDNVVVPAVSALMLILSIKFFEAQMQFRDYMQIYLLSVFLLAASALFELGLIFLFYLSVLFILVSVAVILLTFMAEDADIVLKREHIKKVIIRTLPMPFLAVPLAAVIFVILPRTNFPFLNFLNNAHGAKIGFSDSVGLGDVSDIQGDNSIVLRAKMDRVDGASLYWRGIMLDTFDGARWTSGASRIRFIPRFTGQTVEQIIYLEPYYDRYLFALDTPVDIKAQRRRRAEGFTYYMRFDVNTRMQYRAVSVLSPYIFGKLRDEGRYTALPEISPAIVEIADRFDTDEPIEQIAENVRDYFFTDRFEYTLTDLPQGEGALEDFLTENRRGNCEYYASAMAVILRELGIPARLIGGYRGGFYNEGAGYYVVPQRNAHVWVEVFIEGKGWRRFDPTPAPAGRFTDRGEITIKEQLMQIMDMLNYYWNAFVLTYDFSSQVEIFRNMQDAVRSPSAQLKRTVFIALGAGAVLFIAFTYIRRREINIRPQTSYFERRTLKTFYSELAKAGYAPKAGEGLSALAERVSDEEVRTAAVRFAEIYQKMLYSKAGASRPEIKEALLSLRKKVRRG